MTTEEMNDPKNNQLFQLVADFSQLIEKYKPIMDPIKFSTVIATQCANIMIHFSKEEPGLAVYTWGKIYEEIELYRKEINDSI